MCFLAEGRPSLQRLNRWFPTWSHRISSGKRAGRRRRSGPSPWQRCGLYCAAAWLPRKPRARFFLACCQSWPRCSTMTSKPQDWPQQRFWPGRKTSCICVGLGFSHLATIWNKRAKICGETMFTTIENMLQMHTRFPKLLGHGRHLWVCSFFGPRSCVASSLPLD